MMKSVVALGAVATAAIASVAVSPTTNADPGDVYLTEDFSGGHLPDGWLVDGGDWTIDDGRLVGHTDSGYDPVRLVFGEHRENFRFEATMRFENVVNNSRWAGLITDIDPTGSIPWSHSVIRSATTASNGVEFAARTVNDQWNVTDNAAGAFDVGVGNDVRLRVDIRGNEGEFYLDDELVLSSVSVDRSDNGVTGFVLAGATVSFDDIVMTELEPPVSDVFTLEETFDVDTIPAGWNVVGGAWSVHDGRLHLDEPSSQARITFGPHLDNYELSATMRFDTVNNASRWMGAILDTPVDGSMPWSQAVMRSASTSDNGIEFAIRTEAAGWNVTDRAAAPVDAGTGSDVDVRIRVIGSVAEWYFNDQLVLDTTVVQRSSDGVLGFIADGARVSIDNVVVTELPVQSSRSFVRGPEEGPITIAHRGASAVAPENTLAAVEVALRQGAEMIEIDTHNSADGDTVVIHDGTLDRTTNGTGSVSGTSTADIRSLDAGSWFSPAFANEQVPLLEEVLDLMNGRGATLLLEIKPGASAADTETQLQAVIDRGMEGQVLVQSFDRNVVAAARDFAPSIPRGLLLGSLDSDPVATAEQFGLAAYNPHVSAIESRPEVVAALNEAGVAVMPYTIDDASTWAVLAEIGVDGVITNRPGQHLGYRAGSPIDVTVTNPEPPEPNLTVRVEQAAVQADPTTDGPVLFDIVMSEPTIGLTADDLVIAGETGAATVELTEVTPGVRYQAAVVDPSTDGTVSLSLPAGRLETADGTPNDASVSVDNEVTVTLVAACSVDSDVVELGRRSFLARVHLTNTGDRAVETWELAWELADDVDVTVGWFADVDQTGTTVTATNRSWNERIDPGQSIEIGMLGRYDGGEMSFPDDYLLNGRRCGG